MKVIQLFVDFVLIGERIRERRRSLNINQERLAEMIEKSTVFVSNLENGKKGASLESIVNICLILDLSLDELVFGTQKAYEDEHAGAVLSMFQRCTEREKRFLTELVLYAGAVLHKHEILIPETKKYKKYG